MLLKWPNCTKYHKIYVQTGQRNYKQLLCPPCLDFFFFDQIVTFLSLQSLPANDGSVACRNSCCWKEQSRSLNALDISAQMPAVESSCPSAICLGDSHRRRRTSRHCPVQYEWNMCCTQWKLYEAAVRLEQMRGKLETFISFIPWSLFIVHLSCLRPSPKDDDYWEFKLP